MTPSFWRGRRVFLTGHTGFKGSWLALWLQACGAELTGYALAPPTSPSLFEQAGVAAGMDSRLGDIRDLDALTAALQASRPDVVIHMAAQPLVRRSYQDPLETFSTNVMGTAHVLEAVRATPGVGAVLVVTSDKCYRNDGRTRGYVEEDALGGSDPYSASKAACEIVVGSYLATDWLGAGGPALASARAGNVIGGGDWAVDRLVPDVMRAALGGLPLVVRYPEAVRPWQHVLDCLHGYVLLCERLIETPADARGAWNFGPDPGGAQTVGELLNRLASRWGEPLHVERPATAQPPEARYLHLDSTKARRALGWAPRFAFDDTLDSIVAWYRACQRGGDVAALSRQQIQEFQDRT